MTRRALLEKALLLYELHQQGEIPTLKEHEVHPGLDKGSRENYLYFTLAPAVNFQRSSAAMWQAALRTWNDPKTNWVFFPEKIAGASFAQARDALTQHKLAIQHNKQSEIWHRIALALHEFYESDPRTLLAAADHDAENVLGLLQEEQKERFPYLSGNKLAHYWLYILTHFTDAPLGNREAISVIPDTHIIKSSIHLGVVPEGASPESVAEAWRELLQGTGLAPVDVHSALWNWSRNTFQPAV